MDTNSTSKFFLYDFNKHRNDRNLPSFEIKHTKVWEDNFAAESLQTGNWQYYIEQVLDFSNESSNSIYELLPLSGDRSDRKLLDEMCKNVAICKEHYFNIFENIVTNFQRFLEEIPDQEREKIDNDLLKKTYFLIEDRDNPREITLAFVDFFHNFGRFPGGSPAYIILFTTWPKTFFC